jgi:Homeodomain-like domain
VQPSRVTTLRLALGCILAVLAAAAMYISWGALYETAMAVGGMSSDHAVVFPVIIDVATIAAMLIVLFGKARTWVAWVTFIVFGAITVAGNAAHVVTVDPSRLAMGLGVAIFVNSIPGVALLMVTHLAAVTVFNAVRDVRETGTVPMPAVEAAILERAGAGPATVPMPAVEPASVPVQSTNPTVIARPRTQPATGSKRGAWGAEHREQVVALAAQELTIPQIVERTGIPRSTVGRWLAPAAT